MRKEKSPDDFTFEELRQLLVEKRRKVRSQHLERFRRTGRVVTLAVEAENQSLEHPDSKYQLEDALQDRMSWQSKVKRGLDRVLLAIEILAMLGLVFIVYSGIRLLRDLNAQFAEALRPATLTPTPLIFPVILPSGHTPPNSPGGAQPNEAEIPANLRSVYQAMAVLPIPTSSPEQATRIQIPAIDVDAQVVQGDGWEQLMQGVAQYIGSANPGQAGNMVLSGHNDVYGEIFKDLDQLTEGDEVIVYTPQHAYKYIVTNVQIVEPTDVEVMNPTVEPTVTLISCYPYWVDTQRIIVQASLQSDND